MLQQQRSSVVILHKLSSMKTKPVYTTPMGAAFCGDALDLLRPMSEGSINLVMTSPPFALLREKSYGNETQNEYVDWLLPFCEQVRRVLADDGSFVLDLGGAYQRGFPSRSLHQWRVMIRCVDELGFHLAEEVYWHNPSKLPSPIEWVNKRKLRMKDSVNTMWWFGKTAWPKADVSKVLAPYSARMKTLLKNPDAFYKPKVRPSGHDIGKSFGTDNGGAIPSNLLQIPNTESNGFYIEACKAVGTPAHPARFPALLPQHFVRMLTAPGDIVLDIFAGSNTTGQVAEAEGRHWLAFETSKEFVASSAFRFIDRSTSPDDIGAIYARILAGGPIHLPNNLSSPVRRAAAE
jgi:site-specific DNA-methyltransferase (cytosine-N4-specific)